MQHPNVNLRAAPTKDAAQRVKVFLSRSSGVNGGLMHCLRIAFFYENARMCFGLVVLIGIGKIRRIKPYRRRVFCLDIA
jgi:hypothetical protein